MTGKRNLLFGVILGLLMGWIIVSIFMPFSLKGFSFLLGFIACFILACLGLMYLFFWNKQPFSVGQTDINNDLQKSKKINKSNILLWIFLSSFMILAGLVSSFLLIKQNDLIEARLSFQEKSNKQQVALTGSIKNSGLSALMNNLFDKIEEELKENPKRTLSEETIGRIAALSAAFTPYNYEYLEGDSLSSKVYSPERGQLLLLLLKMGIDSSSFNRILFESSFSNAFLEKADLEGANLSGVDLNAANLKNANLKGADLTKANLLEANLWAADLTRARLNSAELKRTNLRWVDLKQSELKKASINGADLTSANLNGADITDADFRWADLSNAFLKKTNLTNVKLNGTNLSRANLSGANLSGAKLRWALFTEAILRNVNFSKVDLTDADMSNVDLMHADMTGACVHLVSIADKNWYAKLKDWKVRGAEELEKKYPLTDDEFGEADYRLIRKK